MTDTVDPTVDPAPAKKRTGGLNSLLLADLKAMAGGMGVTGAATMKKAQLVLAIKGVQADHAAATAAKASTPPDAQAAPARRARRQDGPKLDAPKQDVSEQAAPTQDESVPERSEQQPVAEPPSESDPRSGQNKPDQNKSDQNKSDQNKSDQNKSDQNKSDQGRNDRSDHDQSDSDDPDSDGRAPRNRRRRGRDRTRTGGGAASNPGGNQGNQGGNQGNHGGNQGSQGANQGSQGSQGANQGGKHGNQHQGGGRHEPDTSILEGDVLVPAAGILDVLDNYAFVRTSGYLPGADDVYLSLSMVRRYGLRRGDAITGQVRQPREGERKEKFNPMVRIDAVNGADPENAKQRVEFATLTPVSPVERLRLETTPTNVVGRMLDLAAPIGKGQRGLILAPPKSGKTTLISSIASSITANNPECHLMVVLVDERPEEVTDFQRSVKGEVIASTFDRPVGDHTLVAELAIERAKRLVELGHDVVVLLDGITRLGRAYNITGTATGKVLLSGIDAAALHPAKQIFGAARNIENGGSLTILATALVESGSMIDGAVLEEFGATANMEVRLLGDLADRRLLPAIDPRRSGTRREELLLSAEEGSIVGRLRRLLATADDDAEAFERLLAHVRRTQTNTELLASVQKTVPADRKG